ncbi:16S rRNA (uracil(1498)-N(3))-methyltransferase [Psychrobacter aestuarii]|uniref:Ribosomal RNA small subunit methyltransferase E n=2 Tax=Psychrobacter aestuarii TaxID=556327 RepID=A0ABN0VPU0_9GAMM
MLFDGFGGEYLVELEQISKKSATVRLLEAHDIERTAPMLSKIALVMSRGDRMDYAIQKATELGVSAIQLLSSHHGEVTLKPAQVEKKLLHWQQVALSACEQCGLNRPPLIIAPQPIDSWLAADTSGTGFAVSEVVAPLAPSPYYQQLLRPADMRVLLSVPAAGAPATPPSLKSLMQQDTPYIELLIGPEGGLSEAEHEQAYGAGFEPWQIGARVMRTETAPVVALASLQALLI